MTAKTADIGTTILLSSGEYFDFLDPTGSVFHLGDIALGLSRATRFHGHTRDFYSVAEHSVWVSRLVPEEDALAALMHDASEAFTGDMSTPLKRLCPDFRMVEDRIMAAVADRFGFAWPLPPSVKEADRLMLATEQRQLRHRHPDDPWLRDAPVADIRIESMAPGKAKWAFMDRYREVTRGRLDHAA